MGSSRRLRSLLLVGLLGLMFAPASRAALGFVFNRASARPGMTVVALQAPGYLPSPKGIVVYLVPTRLPGVNPDPTGAYILFRPPTRGAVRLGPARRIVGRRIGIRFRVPRVPPGNYTIGFWCSTCYRGHGDFFATALWGAPWTGAAGDVLRITR